MEKEIVEKLPKIDLHCHLDGSVPLRTIQKLAKMQNKTIPHDLAALKEKVSAPLDCQSLAEYLQCFAYILQFLQTEEALEIAAYDLLEDVAKENVRYIEVRFAPLLSGDQGLSPEAVIKAVLKGLAKGQADFDVKANALICGMKHFSKEENQQTIEAAKKHLHKGVCGFDLAGDEAAFPQSAFEETAALAKHYQIPLTFHAGECGCPHNVATAVLQGAQRIGHGLAAALDEDVLTLCKEKGIVFELCPISNYQTKAVQPNEVYPLTRLDQTGLLVTINTDNRTVSDTTLTKEYLFLHKNCQITLKDLERFNLHSAEAAFLSESEKLVLRQQITTGFAPYV